MEQGETVRYEEFMKDPTAPAAADARVRAWLIRRRAPPDFEVDFEPAGRRVEVDAGTHAPRRGPLRRASAWPPSAAATAPAAAAAWSSWTGELPPADRRGPARAVAQGDRRGRAAGLPGPGRERHQGPRPQGVADHRPAAPGARVPAGRSPWTRPSARSRSTPSRRPSTTRAPTSTGSIAAAATAHGIRRLHADPVVLRAAHAAGAADRLGGHAPGPRRRRRGRPGARAARGRASPSTSGTTKMAGYLIDLETGEELAAEGIDEPPDRLRRGRDQPPRLRGPAPRRRRRARARRARGARRAGRRRCARRPAWSGTQVAEGCIVGNTAMHHLLLGLPVRQLAQAPFVAATSAPMDVRARDLGITIAPDARIHVLAQHRRLRGRGPRGDDPGRGPGPGRGGQGGRGHRHQHRDRAAPARPWATSPRRRARPAPPSRAPTSATACGLRPAPSRRVRMVATTGCPGDPDDRRRAGGGHLRLGDRGRRRRAVPDRADRLPGPPPGGRPGRGPRASAAWRWSSRPPRPAASAAPCPSPSTTSTRSSSPRAPSSAGSRSCSTRPARTRRAVDEVVVAGAFGSYLNLDSALDIGLLPRLPNASYVQVGNAAGTGARAALLSLRERARARDIAHEAGYVELTTYPGFQTPVRQVDALPPFRSTRLTHGLPDHRREDQRHPQVRRRGRGRPRPGVHRGASRAGRPKPGATWIDVNAGTSPEREPDDLVWLVRTVQAVTELPLSIDTANPKALARGPRGRDKDAARQLDQRRAGPGSRASSRWPPRPAARSSPSPSTTTASRPPPRLRMAVDPRPRDGHPGGRHSRRPGLRGPARHDHLHQRAERQRRHRHHARRARPSSRTST